MWYLVKDKKGHFTFYFTLWMITSWDLLRYFAMLSFRRAVDSVTGIMS